MPDPAEFLKGELPKLFAGVAAEVGDGPGSICFTIPGLGSWSIAISGGEITVADGRSDDTVVEIAVGADDWEEALARFADGRLGVLSLNGEGRRSLRGMLSDPRALATLELLRGTLRLDTKSDFGGSTVFVTFGGSTPRLEKPRMTLEIEEDVATLVASGEVNPFELFVAGKLQVAGDQSMLQQLGPLFM